MVPSNEILYDHNNSDFHAFIIHMEESLVNDVKKLFMVLLLPTWEGVTISLSTLYRYTCFQSPWYNEAFLHPPTAQSAHSEVLGFIWCCFLWNWGSNYYLISLKRFQNIYYYTYLLWCMEQKRKGMVRNVPIHVYFNTGRLNLYFYHYCIPSNLFLMFLWFLFGSY